MHIQRIRVVSANQLKSGDLSIKAARREDAEALKQFANDWVDRVGRGATIRLPTYGILAHGIRTSTMDTEKFEEIKAILLHDNRPFIPNADITYIGWLSRASLTKSASTIIVELSSPEDANKIIDEGLIWQGEAFQCERYDRQCRLKQCYQCQRYGHIGTQCKASATCGYCAEAHSSKDCPSKADKSTARKCAVCKGAHEAWNHRCPVRKTELSKVKAAYDARQPYHFVPSIKGRVPVAQTFFGATPTPAESVSMVSGVQTSKPRGRPRASANGQSSTPTLLPMAGSQTSRSKSPTKGRAPKRVNLGTGTIEVRDEKETRSWRKAARDREGHRSRREEH
jgi:hypothetical protein